MKAPTILTAILISSLYILCPIILRFFLHRKKTNKVFAIVLLCLYSTALILGVFTNVQISNETVVMAFSSNNTWASEPINLNIIPFTTIDFIINIVLLFPIGVVIILFDFYKRNRCNLKKSIIKLLLVGLIVGFSIEFFQFILPVERTVQLSDIILNTLSCTLGGMYFALLLKIKRI